MELKDQDNIWCSSASAPVAAEKPTATSGGSKAMIGSGNCLLTSTGCTEGRSSKCRLATNVRVVALKLMDAVMVPFSLKVGKLMVALLSFRVLRSMPMWSEEFPGSKKLLNVSNSTATNRSGP